jgi:hypothetical protein
MYSIFVTVMNILQTEQAKGLLDELSDYWLLRKVSALFD